jgi:hypothetical protein
VKLPAGRLAGPGRLMLAQKGFEIGCCWRFFCIAMQMLSPGGSCLQYTGQDDTDERDDDEVLLLHYEDSDDAVSENQALNASSLCDVRTQHCAAASTTAPILGDSFEEYPPSYRHPPSNVEWPRSEGYAADLKNFEISDESDCEQGSDEDETLYFANTIVDQKVLSVGDECLCLDSRDGQQWVATIKKKTVRHALVHYKRWSKSCDDWVSLSSISPKPTQVMQRLSRWCNFDLCADAVIIFS